VVSTHGTSKRREMPLTAIPAARSEDIIGLRRPSEDGLRAQAE